MYYIAQHLNVQEGTFSFLTLRVHFMVSHQLELLSNIFSTAQKIISLLSRPVMWMLMRMITVAHFCNTCHPYIARRCLTKPEQETGTKAN